MGINKIISLFNKKDLNRSSVKTIEDMNREITKGYDVIIKTEQNDTKLTFYDEVVSRVICHRKENGLTHRFQILRSIARTRKFCRTVYFN